MIVLVVEDEEPKRANITSALSTMLPGSSMLEARSVHSAIKLLRTTTPDLIILDMSLPTFDVGPGESGGRPQGFGGVEVLRYIDRFGLRVPVIIVTAYEAFAKGGEQIDLERLRSEMATAHTDTFRGVVYYNSVYESWRTELEVLLKSVVGSCE